VTGERRLAFGEWVDFEDEAHQVVGFCGTGVRLRSHSGQQQLIATAVLLADPSFRPASPAAETPGLDPQFLLHGLDSAEKDRVLTLEGHLLEITTGFRRGEPDPRRPGEPHSDYGPQRTMREKVTAKAGELGLGVRTVWRMLDDWRALGLWGLVDKRKARPHDALARIDPRIVEAVREQHAADRDDSAAGGPKFRRRVHNRLEVGYGPGVVTLPSKDTFRRAVGLILEQSPAGPTARKRADGLRPDRPLSVMTAQRPGQVVLLDTTPLDVKAYDPDVDDVIGVELTVALDVATRSILAWRITVEGTQAVDIGLLLADMMAPEPMRLGWPDALKYAMMQLPVGRLLDIDARLAHAAARPVVYPETLVFDHGKPYQADAFKRACHRFGINRQDARKLQPTDKAQIERYFGTVAQQFSQHVAGYKGNDVAHRGRDIEKVARWTVTELEEFFAEYVVAVYQRQHHDGLFLHGFRELRMSPNEAYAHAVAATGYVTCPTDPTLYYELLPIHARKIHPSGVELGYLTYNADVLYRYRNTRSPYPDGKWPIRQDPRDMLHAYFHDPDDGTWHVLRWTHALDQHQPFTDVTLREAKRLLAARGRAPADQAEVAVALTALQNRTDAPESWTRSDRRRRSRDAERARAATRDRNRAEPVANDSPRLHLVDDPAEPSGLDLSTVRPAAVWNPRAGGR
jgi:transposase InsO family protein